MSHHTVGVCRPAGRLLSRGSGAPFSNSYPWAQPEQFSLLVTRFTSSVDGYTAALLGMRLFLPFLTGLPKRVTGAQVAAPQRSGFLLAPADERVQRQFFAHEPAQWLDLENRPLVEEADLPRGRIQLCYHLSSDIVAAHIVLVIVQPD